MADKFGEVFITTFISSEQGTLSRILLLGHCSLVTDMILSPDGAYIATCDRDEKIRVSQFPKSYEIESFCMGHSQFVFHVLSYDGYLFFFFRFFCFLLIGSQQDWFFAMPQ